MLQKNLGAKGMQKFIEVVAERKFKQAIQLFCDGFSVQDLEFYSVRNLSLTQTMARIGRAPPTPTPAERLNPGARYLLNLPTGKLLSLIREVAPDHARILSAHPAYADKLLAELKGLLVR